MMKNGVIKSKTFNFLTSICIITLLSSHTIFANTPSNAKQTDTALTGNNNTERNISDITKSIDQENRQISGVVKDKNGETLIGASVLVKGTTIGTITDFDGKFQLAVPNNYTVLVFSSIGYESKEIRIGTQYFLDVTLEESTEILEEVVVVGYGSQKKVNLTGAVTQVDSKVFEARPVTSMATALQGAIPGVNISPSTGNPNEDISFNIRGTTSINGASPLVLVDGVEMDIKLVNPNDIESVSVLKDAASSAIYGVRAAYGVVLITTKKGKAGKLSVSYSGNFSFSKPTVMPEFVDNSYEHALFVNAGSAREDVALMYDVDHLAAIKAYYDNPATAPLYYISENNQYKYAGYMDWQDMILRNVSPKQQHNVNISGGSGKTRFYTSIGHVREEGQIKINPNVFQRTNVRLNVEDNTYDWMKLGFKILYNTSTNDEPHNYKDSFWHQVVFSSPTRPYMWYGDPAYPQYDQYAGMYFDDQNPVSLLDLGGRNKLKTQEIVLSPSIDLNPIKNWNIHVDFSYIKLNTDKTSHRKKVDMINARFSPTEGNTKDNSYEIVKGEKEYYSFNAYTDYEFSLNDKHNFKAMIGYNQELTKYKSNTAKRVGLLLQDQPTLGLGSGAQTVDESGYEWALRGGFARINYNYDNRYLLEINGRYDGTSRFPKNDRFVFVPSFSAAWRLSEEKFMQFSRTLFDNIKIRGSYGKLGNQLLSESGELWTGNDKYYPYIPFLTHGNNKKYLFNGLGTDIITNPANLVPSTLTWEKSATINGGIDLTLLSSRLDLSFDIYKRTTSDMLIFQDFPDILGTKSPAVNEGELETRGWELSINWKDNIGKDFSYEVGLSLFDSQAKITKYEGSKSTVDGYYVGKKIGEIWGYETEGIFQSEDEILNHADQSYINKIWTPGDIKYKDLDESEKIDLGANTPEDPGDRKVIGNTTPRYNYGINLRANYKDFFMSIFFQGVGKRDFWPTNQAFFPLGTQYYNTQKWHITDSWSEDNPNAYLPIPRARNTKNYQAQTRYLQDGSYVRLKNFTFGYNIPIKWLQKIKLSRAQVYFSGENLWEHSNVKGPYDPEAAAKKGEMVYPFQRNFSIGVDLTF